MAVSSRQSADSDTRQSPATYDATKFAAANAQRAHLQQLSGFLSTTQLAVLGHPLVEEGARLARLTAAESFCVSCATFIVC